MTENIRHYCTYFDSNYLLQGLALYHSLEEHERMPFILWVLCFDERAYQVLQLLALPGMRLISQKDFELGDEALRQAKQNRSMVEYYWTCTPSLPLYILALDPQVEQITYLDADLFFFSDPAPIFDELGAGSILIVGHRFPPALKSREPFGIYNVGLLSFLRDPHGLASLNWWRDRCNEWCYMNGEDGRYGDQKYLDDWPTRFQNVVVLQHVGAGLAPWNLAGYSIHLHKDQVYVDDVPLIFFHFHQFKMVTHQSFVHNTQTYLENFDTVILNYIHIRYIYIPYAQTIRNLEQKFQDQLVNFRSPYEKIPLLSWLHMLSKGIFFLARDDGLSDLIAKIGLWRAGSLTLATKGFRLFEKGDLNGAKKALVASACRSPRILLDPRFWRVLAH